MLKYRKIIHINFILFFGGWVIIFLLGADFPPPMGFIWLVLLIFVLDIVQTHYLRQYFLPHIENEKKTKLFIRNTLFYFLGGLIISILTVLSNFQTIGALSTLIWIAMVTVVGVFYGIAFWFFNILLFHVIK